MVVFCNQAVIAGLVCAVPDKTMKIVSSEVRKVFRMPDINLNENKADRNGSRIIASGILQASDKGYVR